MGLNKILSGLTGTLALLMAVAILAMAGCGDDDDNGLGQVTVGDDTYDICESTEDCSGDEVCEGSTTVDGDPVDYCVEPAGEPNAEPNNNDQPCDPQAVCEDYCMAKVVGCMEENCADPSIAEAEMELCMGGIAYDETGEEGLDGCVAEASITQSACEDFEAQAETLAEQECGSDEQQKAICADSIVRYTEGGEGLIDDCGCEVATPAAQCQEDADCAAYGLGTCYDNADGSGHCAADCYDFDGNPPSWLVPDPACGMEGACMFRDQLGTAQIGGGPTPGQAECVLPCTTADDCPTGHCIVYASGSTEDGEFISIGICNNQFWDGGEAELCDDASECSDEGAGCVGGQCYNSCESDVECENGNCNVEAGHCDPNLQ